MKIYEHNFNFKYYEYSIYNLNWNIHFSIKLLYYNLFINFIKQFKNSCIT